MTAPDRKELIVLAADKNTQFAVRGLLSRHEALGIRRIRYDVYAHPESDPGCCLRGELFLKPFTNEYAHALVMFDREGCGRETFARFELENEMEDRLARTGWSGRASAIVLDPELEAWVWSDSPQVDQVLGWHGRRPAVRAWLVEQGFVECGHAKPVRPKEAVQTALKVVRKPRSSALYEKLAKRVSLERCTDPAFAKFRSTIHAWFHGP